VNEVPTSHALIRFGVFELDTESRELRKQGLKVRLQDQPFQILQILLERPGRVVTREELQRRIWPSDTFVDFDRGLYNAIKKLREALGDSAESPRFIETLSRRGYRFIAAVEGSGQAAAAAPVPTLETTESLRSWNLRVGIGLGLGAVILAGVLLGMGKLWRRFSGASAATQIRSIAVLPLQNLSGDPNQEYFSDGMTDGLITDLAQIGSWRVISRTSSMQYKQTKKSLPEIARELNVDGIIEGTVQRSGDRVRITAQLIDAPEDKHLWASTYERDMQDVFALEREITSDIAHEVKARLTANNHAPPAQLRPINPKVLDIYLRANFHLDRFASGFGDEEKRKASELFQQAIEAEPDFAPGYVGLAGAHLDREQSSGEDLAVAKRAAERAAQLDPASSDVWVILAEVNEEHLLDWSAAEADYRKAISLNPNNAHAHDMFGEFLGEMGHLDEGLKECEIAQQLDPNNDHLGSILYLRREYDRAIAVIQVMIKNHPDNGYLHLMLYQVYTKKEMHKEAAQELVQAVRLFGLGEAATHINRAFARSGYSGAIRQFSKELEHLHDTKQAFFPGNLVLTYAALGEKDRAFYWLEQAYQHRELVGTDVPLPYLVRDPMADPLRSDLRFGDFLRHIGLPQ
jgi:TolB-like protein/DNA-binding winged helix-turn-helix (wHTH) protein